MCKLGDIIVIKEFKNEFGKKIKRHSFVVINDEENIIEGMKYDLICNMLCSFHDETHRNKKLKYKENLEINNKNLLLSKRANDKNGFIKADQLYYFDKSLIKYYIIGNLNLDNLNNLLKIINELDLEDRIKIITTNLKENEKFTKYRR